MTIATRLRVGTVLGAWACVWACAAQTATMTVETVTPGVVRVTYADGSRLLANYGAQAVSVEGHAVPPLDYVVVPGRAEAKGTP